MQVGTRPNVLEYTSLPDSISQRHTVTIPGIKLSHLVYHGTTVYYPFYCTDQGWPATWTLETTPWQST